MNKLFTEIKNFVCYLESHILILSVMNSNFVKETKIKSLPSSWIEWKNFYIVPH